MVGTLAGLTVAGLFSASGASVCLEAEAATELKAPMHVVNLGKEPVPAKAVKGASGNQYLEIPEGAGKPPEVGGEASLSFEAPEAGTYVLWCRVWWPDGCGNSLGLSMDGGPAFTFGQDATYGKWHWWKAPARLKQLELTKGPHMLKISNREDGAILDQLLLTTDTHYVPVDIEAVTSPPVPAK